MPRYNAKMTLYFWMDAESENDVESEADGIERFVQHMPEVNLDAYNTELVITEEPRPTNAELSSTV